MRPIHVYDGMAMGDEVAELHAVAPGHAAKRAGAVQEHARRPLQHPGVPGDCAGDLPGLHRPGGQSDDLQLAAPVPDDRSPVQLPGARAGGAERLDGQDRPDPGGADAGCTTVGRDS